MSLSSERLVNSSLSMICRHTTHFARLLSAPGSRDGHRIQCSAMGQRSTPPSGLALLAACWRPPCAEPTNMTPENINSSAVKSGRVGRGKTNNRSEIPRWFRFRILSCRVIFSIHFAGLSYGLCPPTASFWTSIGFYKPGHITLGDVGFCMAPPALP